ncbi:hypothetical protein JNW98_22130, partial [Streptomyces sp. SCA2-4]|nr:hypothetical protein [Streptomyces huiliensis]
MYRCTDHDDEDDRAAAPPGAPPAPAGRPPEHVNDQRVNDQRVSAPPRASATSKPSERGRGSTVFDYDKDGASIYRQSFATIR